MPSRHSEDPRAGASIWVENGGVVRPGLKTGGLFGPKNSIHGVT